MQLRITENPISAKELQRIMRDYRAFILITVYLSFIALAIGFIYYDQTSYYATRNLAMRSELGKNLFYATILIELVLINFIAPGLTSGAITSERERKTLELIKTTLITPYELIIGKFTPAIVYVLLLIFTTLPIQMIVSTLGGITVSQVIIATLILFITGAFFCALGIFLSSGFKKTIASTITAYSFNIFPIILFIFFYLFINNGPPDSLIDPKYEVYWLYGLWALVSTNPFTTALVTQVMLDEMQSLFIIQTPPLSGTIGYTFISPWILYCIFYVIMTSLLLLASTRLVAKTEK